MKRIFFLLVLCASHAWAHPPAIVEAKAIYKTNKLFDIAVTIAHADTGWGHYANEWVVLSKNEDGQLEEIAKRKLYHPHVNEQPFTRYLRDINLPQGKLLYIRAKCSQQHESSLHRLK